MMMAGRTLRLHDYSPQPPALTVTFAHVWGVCGRMFARRAPAALLFY